MARKQLPRLDPRFSLSKTIPAAVTIVDGGEERVAHGQALEISLRGAKLSSRNLSPSIARSKSS